MKKMMSLLLAFALMLSLVTPTLATGNADFIITNTASSSSIIDDSSDISLDAFSKNERDEIAKQVNKLAELGVFAAEGSRLLNVEGKKTKIRDAEANNFRYTVDYGPFSETIEFLEDNDDRLSLHISSDRVDNILTIYSDGKIFLDGNEVIVTYEEDIADKELSSTDDTASTRSSDRWFQYACPYGGAGDYSTFVSSHNKANINMGSNLGSIGYSTASLILAGISNPFSLTLGISAILWGVIAETAPDSYGLSYRALKYRHKNSPVGGYISQIGQYVYKWNIDWYARTNYQNYVTNNIQYEVKVIY